MDFFRIMAVLSAGVVNTLLLAVSSMGLGLAGGTALMLAHQLSGPRLRMGLRGGVAIIQSIPALVLIFMAMFGLPRIGFQMPPFLTVVSCLGLVTAAYVCEVLRGAVASIDRTQWEAGLALGMSPRRVLWSVMLPQTWRLAVPGLINEFTSVLKATPFAYVAGVPEILKEAQALTAVTSRGLPVYGAAALLFLLLYLGCGALFHTLYRRHHIPGFEET